MDNPPSSNVGGPRLELLEARPHTFEAPTKRIHDGQDLSSFLTSLAYHDIVTFLFQLNRSMFPSFKDGAPETIESWDLSSPITLKPPTQRLQQMINALDAMIEEAPPDTGPRRFGNVSFRKWYDLVESRMSALLEEAIDPDVLGWPTSPKSEQSAETELRAYLFGSFGSSQRLDYGTGHELSFLAFLGCLWKLGTFPQSSPGVEERSIVIGVIEPYLRLIRRLILTYNLEPAGSHGVWGLDDHFFIPYIFGSAQFSPAIAVNQPVPTEGSLPKAPEPSDVTNSKIVERERNRNMYFAAIGFIYDVKKGPFWEHSPMLFDISGIRTGWAKVNKGMMKMYNAEVLSKFPVVQHFAFGSLFRWDQDPNTASVAPSAHHSSQPPSQGFTTNQETSSSLRRVPQESTKAPRASASHSEPLAQASAIPSTVAPWAKAPASSTTSASKIHPPTQTSWVKSAVPSSALGPGVPTRAPWAKPEPGEQEMK